MTEDPEAQTHSQGATAIEIMSGQAPVQGPAVAPCVFISYSHDSNAHKGWVLALATRLRGSGVDVTLDQWDLRVGGDLTSFMERAICRAARVVVVLTENYVRKADERMGGSGYEMVLMSAEILRNVDTAKFLPVVRQSAAPVLPRGFGPRLYLDFSNELDFESRLEDLLREIHSAPALRKPEVGSNPFLNERQSASSLPGADVPSNVRFVAATRALESDYLRAPRTGLQFWQDGAPVPMMRTRGFIRVDMAATPFRIRLPRDAERLTTCCSADPIVLDLTDVDRVGSLLSRLDTGLPWGGGNTIASTEYGDATLWLSPRPEGSDPSARVRLHSQSWSGTHIECDGEGNLEIYISSVGSDETQEPIKSGLVVYMLAAVRSVEPWMIDPFELRFHTRR